MIISRPEARNAIDPATAKELYQAFIDFDHDESAAVAVLWGEGGAFCAGWDLKQAAALDNDDFFERHNMPKDDGKTPPALLGPSRLELDKPVIAAVAGPSRCRRYGTRAVVRFSGDGGKRLFLVCTAAAGAFR